MTTHVQALQCIRRVGAVALGAVALLTMAPAAYSNPFILQGYYEEQGQVFCENAVDCNLVFSAPGGPLIVSYVSCSLQASGSSLATLFAITTARAGSSYGHLTLNFVGTTGGTRYFTSSNQVLKLYKSSSRPEIKISFTSGTTISLLCEIAGRVLS
jgi:hypothetical protein